MEQKRYKSWALWASLAGAIWTILSAYGLPQQWGFEEGAFKAILDSVGAILIAFGICNNPTDKLNF